MMNSANENFSYKMQQMSDFSCKNQPGRPKKKYTPPKKNAHPFEYVLETPSWQKCTLQVLRSRWKLPLVNLFSGQGPSTLQSPDLTIKNCGFVSRNWDLKIWDLPSSKLA
jgi:hypothetical protein